MRVSALYLCIYMLYVYRPICYMLTKEQVHPRSRDANAIHAPEHPRRRTRSNKDNEKHTTCPKVNTDDNKRLHQQHNTRTRTRSPTRRTPPRPCLSRSRAQPREGAIAPTKPEHQRHSRVQHIHEKEQIREKEHCHPTTAPALSDTFKAISKHFKARYGDTGEAAQLALQRHRRRLGLWPWMAKMGAPLFITDEAIQRAVETLSRRKGTAPSPGGVPCEFLKALGPKCVRRLAEAMTTWSADKGQLAMPEMGLFKIVMIPTICTAFDHNWVGSDQLWLGIDQICAKFGPNWGECWSSPAGCRSMFTKSWVGAEWRREHERWRSVVDLTEP